MNECPYKKTLSNISEFKANAEEIINNNTKNLNPNNNAKVCPFSKNAESGPKKETKDEKTEKEDSDDEKPKGGCPVMNKGNFISK